MTTLPMWIALTPAEAFDLLTLASLTEHRTAGEQATLDRLAAGLSSLAEGEGTPPHLVPVTSADNSKGPKCMPGIQGSWPGSQVILYESSSDTPGMWVVVVQAKARMPVEAHLTLEHAKHLRDQLDYLIRSAGA